MPDFKEWVSSHVKETIAIILQTLSVVLVICGSVYLNSKFEDLQESNSKCEGLENIKDAYHVINSQNIICRIESPGSNIQLTKWNDANEVGHALCDSSIFWSGFYHVVLALLPPIFKVVAVCAQFLIVFKYMEFFGKNYKVFGMYTLYFVIGSVLYTVPAFPFLDITLGTCLYSEISESLIVNAKTFSLLFFIFYLVGLIGVIGAPLVHRLSDTDSTAVVPVFYHKSIEGTHKTIWWIFTACCYLGLTIMLISFIFLIIFVAQSFSKLQAFYLFFLVIEIPADVLLYFIPRAETIGYTPAP